jgi:hypothetical protein
LAKFLISMAKYLNRIYLVAVMGVRNTEAKSSTEITGAAGTA